MRVIWNIMATILKFYTEKNASDAPRKQRYHKNHVKVKEVWTSDPTDKTAK